MHPDSESYFSSSSSSSSSFSTSPLSSSWFLPTPKYISQPFLTPITPIAPKSTMIAPTPAPVPSPRRAPLPPPMFSPRRHRMRHIRMKEPAKHGLFTVSEQDEMLLEHQHRRSSIRRKRLSTNTLNSGKGGSGMLSAKPSSDALGISPLNRLLELPTDITEEVNVVKSIELVKRGEQKVVEKRLDDGIMNDEEIFNRLSWDSNHSFLSRSSSSLFDNVEGLITPTLDMGNKNYGVDRNYFLDVPVDVTPYNSEDELKEFTISTHPHPHPHPLPVPKHQPQLQLLKSSYLPPAPVSVPQKAVGPGEVKKVKTNKSKRPPPLDLRSLSNHPYAYKSNITDWSSDVSSNSSVQSVLLPPLPILSSSEYKSKRRQSISSTKPSTSSSKSHSHRHSRQFQSRSGSGSSRKSKSDPPSASYDPNAPTDLESALQSLLASCGITDDLLFDDIDNDNKDEDDLDNNDNSYPVIPEIRRSSATSEESTGSTRDLSTQFSSFPLPPPRSPPILSPTSASTFDSFDCQISTPKSAPITPRSSNQFRYLNNGSLKSPPLINKYSELPLPPLPSTPKFNNNIQRFEKVRYDHYAVPKHSHSEMRNTYVEPKFEGNHSFLQSLSRGENPIPPSTASVRNKKEKDERGREAKFRNGSTSSTSTNLTNASRSTGSGSNSSRSSGKLPSRSKLPAEWMFGGNLI